MTEPTPPENVSVVLDDGEEIAIECRYDGVNDLGLHVWIAVTEDIPLHRIRSIKADVMPARTSIAIGVTP